MTPAQLKKVVDSHKHRIDASSRMMVTNVCQFVEDLLAEELVYLKEADPTAVADIADMEKAVESVKQLWYGIDNMETDDLVKERIWNK